jgi:pSer/pThr/pTyr-binding forkhead associated (FHA) protein
MPFDITLFLLRIGLVALLYLFLLQVVLLIRRDLGRTNTAALPGRLVVIEAGQSGFKPGDTLPLGPVNVIGRSPASDILLPDDSVSTRHAQLSRRGRQWWLEDLGSTNGTRVNGRFLESPMVVTEGDILEFGRVRLQLERSR